jgi:hypothetical protein
MKLAAYNPAAPQPAPVIGWYDLDAFEYSTLPDAHIELTEDQWAHRLAGFWAVSNGALVPLAPPVPPPSSVPVITIINQSATALALSQAKALAAKGDTAGALAAALQLLEGIIP